MDTLKIRLRVNPDAAIRAGRNQAGEVLVTVPLDLTDQQRETLLSLPRDKYSGYDQPEFFDLATPPKSCPDFYGVDIHFQLPAIPDASDQSVKTLLDAYPGAIETYRRKMQAYAMRCADAALTARNPTTHDTKFDEFLPADMLAELKVVRAELNAEIEAKRRKQKAEEEARKESIIQMQMRDDEKKEKLKRAGEAWIEEHGSPRLRRLVKEGFEYGAVYRDERLALERPGWAWENDPNLSYDPPRNPPQEALDLLDRARESDPECYLRYYKLSVEDGYRDYHQYGYLVLGEYMGKTVVYHEMLETRSDEDE
jgi:hypothetical protein